MRHVVNGRPRLFGKVIGFCVVTGVVVGTIVLSGLSHASAVATQFESGGPLSTSLSYEGGSVAFQPPSSDFNSLATSNGVPVTAATIMSEYVSSPSPFVTAAQVASWGEPVIYQASFTDTAQGPIDQTTEQIVPQNVNRQVWIVTYRNVHSPLSMVANSPGVQGGTTGVTKDTGDAYTIYTPGGVLIESMLLPTASIG